MERPKVRFKRTSRTTETEKKNVSNSKGKVTIKSIVPTNFPLKLLKNGKHLLTKDQFSTDDVEINKENYLEENYFFNKKISEYDSNPVPSILYMSDTCGSSNLEIVANKSSAGNHYYHVKLDNENENLFEIQNCADDLEVLTINDSSNTSQNQSIDNKSTNKSLENKFIETNKLCTTYDNTNVDNTSGVNNNYKNINSVQKSDKKTNFSSKSKLIIKNKYITCDQLSEPLRKNTGNYCIDMSSKKTENELPPSSTIKIFKDTIKPHFNIPKSGYQEKMQPLTPCNELKTDSLTKNKFSKRSEKQVKNLYISKNQPHISIEPGISKQYNKNIENENRENKSFMPKHLLFQPEYNSTICVMKKLKHIAKRKLVIHVDHLPSAYKNVIQKKVSTALDFAPYESVYNDLINLSVDNVTFPANFMRSKDPEPRNKDIVPKISDFYRPNYTQQYFAVLNPIIPKLFNLNTLSAFTISNKICTWKICTDKF